MKITSQELLVKLKNVIKNKNISQENIAKKLGYKSRQNITSFLNAANINLDKFLEILQAADISLLDLLEVDTSQNIVSSDLAKLAADIQQAQDIPLKEIIAGYNESRQLKAENAELKKGVDSAVIDRLEKLEAESRETAALKIQVKDLQKAVARCAELEEENEKLKKAIVASVDGINQNLLKKAARLIKHGV